MNPLFADTNDSVFDHSPTRLAVYARERQRYLNPGFSVSVIVYDVVSVPGEMSSFAPVRLFSGKLSSSDHSKRYFTSSVLPVKVAFVTLNVTPVSESRVPPIGVVSVGVVIAAATGGAAGAAGAGGGGATGVAGLVLAGSGQHEGSKEDSNTEQTYRRLHTISIARGLVNQGRTLRGGGRHRRREKVCIRRTRESI